MTLNAIKLLLDPDAATVEKAQAAEALKEAPKRGWLVVDMKQDWNTIFRPE
jgi:hypothetical protein